MAPVTSKNQYGPIREVHKVKKDIRTVPTLHAEIGRRIVIVFTIYLSIYLLFGTESFLTINAALH